MLSVHGGASSSNHGAVHVRRSTVAVLSQVRHRLIVFDVDEEETTKPHSDFTGAIDSITVQSHFMRCPEVVLPLLEALLFTT